MKKRALKKEFHMEVKKSLNRFLSIFFIVAMGVAFFSGIQASAPDMRATGDYYFDSTNLMDLKVLSTLGITEEDLHALAEIEGVQEVMGSCMEDVYCGEDDALQVLHVETMLDGMNELTVREGRLPEKAGECFLDDSYAEKMGCKVGDELKVTVSSEEDTQLARTVFTISGIGYSPNYVAFERGSTSLGNGSVSGFVYVLPEDFDAEVYSVAYLHVDGAKDEMAYTDGYDELVDAVYDRLEEIGDVRCEVRYSEVMGEAREKLDDAKQEVADGKQELADAKQELEDGKREADSELAQAESELTEGESELAEGKEKLADSKQELLDGEQEVADGESEIGENERKLEDARGQIEDGRAQLAQGESEYRSGLSEYQKQSEQAEEKLAKAEQQIRDGEAELESARKEIEKQNAKLAEGEQELLDGETQLVQSQTVYEEGMRQFRQGQEQYEEGAEKYEAGLAQYKDGLGQYKAGKKQYDEGLAQYEAGLEQYLQQKEVLDAGWEAYYAGADQIAAAKGQWEAGAAALEAANAEYEANAAALKKGQEAYEAGAVSLEQQKGACQEQENQAAALEAGAQAALQEKAGYEAQQGELSGKIGQKSSEVSAKQAELDAAVAHRDALAADPDSDGEELQAAVSRVTSLNAELDVLKGELSALESDQAALSQKAAEAEARAAEASGQAAAIREALAGAQAAIQAAEAALPGQKAELDAQAGLLAQGKEQLDAQSAQLAAAKQELDGQEAVLSEKKGELEAGNAQLAAAKEQLDAVKAQLDGSKEQLDAVKEQLDGSKEQLDASKLQLADAKKELDANELRLADAKSQLDAGWKELADGKEEISAGKEQIADAKEQLDAGQKELEDAKGEVESGKKQLADAKKQLNSARRQLDNGWAELNASNGQLADGESQLADARRQLADARAELADGRRQIADAEEEIAENEQKLKDGWKDYEDGKREADDEIAEGEQKIADAEQELLDAEQKIADAEAELADLKYPKWYVYDRSELPDNAGFGENAERLTNIAKVFPVLFFLVAALISLTTMTRMVEEERTQIGTMKALGYSKRDIASKYLKYAFYATIGGSVFGVLVGEKIFPWIIVNAYGIMYQYLPKVLIPYDLGFAAVAAGAALFCTMAATLSACIRELQAVPAALMRPPSPKDGKRVLLEYLPFVWRRLSFTWKSTVRNLVRYKKRFLMTVIGIGGCMGLLLVGFGLRDSIMDVAVLQFDELQLEDEMVILDTDASEAELEEIVSSVVEDDRVYAQKRIYMQKEQVRCNDGTRKEWAVYLYVPEDTEQLEDFFCFRDRNHQEVQYTLTDEGAIVTEKFAKQFGVKAGDVLTLESAEETVELPVAAVCENYLSHYIYLTPALYEQVYGERPVYNSIFIRTDNGLAEAEEIGTELLSRDAVLNVTYTKSLKDQLDQMLSALDIVIVVLIVSAGMLAFVVLYNLNNININERRRELATLKVLGFFDGEVASYVYRENILLTLIGAAFGILVGKFLHAFIIVTVEVDICMFGRNIKNISYVYGTLFTFGFSLLVNLAMYYKLKRIDMVESLKSVE